MTDASSGEAIELIVKDSVIVVTGAGIVVAADLDMDRALETAAATGGEAFRCDAGREEDVRGPIERVQERHGPIDLFCSNAGIGAAFDMSFENAAGSATHAAVGFAENLAITHRDDGIRVSILCPQAVDTPMLAGLPEGPQSIDGVMSAPDVVRIALAGWKRMRSHPPARAGGGLSAPESRRLRPLAPQHGEVAEAVCIGPAHWRLTFFEILF